ncbi:MAG: hypothetical protein RLY40_968 [Pseudomonadota bacterium]|jgi:hypothetical protein
MIETLWITLPINEENKLKEIFNSIKNKNLTNTSISQLIEKLENNQAADWIDVLEEYNSIPSINNINSQEMLNRAKSVRSKFDRKNSKGESIYPELKNTLFAPNELLSLVIMCYSNPNLIGPKLCAALNGRREAYIHNNQEKILENEALIKKEMLENSAYRRSENRVLPSQSNLRLVGTGLFFEDMVTPNNTLTLPVTVINRVTAETIRDGRVVRKLDQRGGFEEWINGTERTARDRRSLEAEDTYAVLQSLKSAETSEGLVPPSLNLDSSTFASRIGYANQSGLTPEVLASNSANSTSSHGNVLLIGSLALFQIARNSPVGAVVRNIGKDLVTASKQVGSFFSKKVECEEQNQNAPLLSPTTKA